MNASDQSFISSEVTTNFGKNLRQSQVDPQRLTEALATVVADNADDGAVAALTAAGAHLFVVPADGDGFEVRLGHHDLDALNPPGAVAGEFVTLGVLRTEDINVLPPA
ncbi:MAG: hypothetical protein QOE60_1951 [Thermoleophilaceae bacterium]|jgi:hypothetical protein|nr:hypothetical protein [Thermoleophilaceae bacterium]